MRAALVELCCERAGRRRRNRPRERAATHSDERSMRSADSSALHVHLEWSGVVSGLIGVIDRHSQCEVYLVGWALMDLNVAIVDCYWFVKD